MDDIKILSLSEILGDNKEIEQIEEPLQMVMSKEQIDNMRRNAAKALRDMKIEAEAKIRIGNIPEEETAEVKQIKSIQPLHIYEEDDEDVFEFENRGTSR